MTGLVGMLNHLAAAWLSQQVTSAAGVSINRVELDSQGGLVALWLESGGFRGEVLLRLLVEPPQGTRYTVRVEIERWPERVPAALQPLRAVLETARMQVSFDLAPSG